jgi:D-alanyl-D-alanine carboxypeptidase/D-alanyl-D-alanine-endopeptidase (penicillin-binding protein 4)
MQQDFGVEKLKYILPTGGTGTLKNYFTSDSSFIYAKTGSLSNNFTLTGFLTTKKNRQFIFAVMLNNYQGSSKEVRKAIEKYLHEVRMRN